MRYLLAVLLFISTHLLFAAQTCTTTQIGNSSNDFKGISGSSDSNVIAVGKNGVVYTYNGSSWASSSSGTNQNLEDVFVLNSNVSYAVGDNGTIRIYNGTSWSGSSSGTSEDLNGVWAYSTSEVFAVGDNGTLLRFNGSSWSDLSGAAGTGSIDLEDAWGNNSNFYALGKNGNLYVYNRSGDSWSTITTCASVAGDDVNDLWGDSSGNIYIAGDGGAVYKYDGSTCTTVATASEDLDGIFGSDTTGEIYAVGKDGLVVYYNGSSWISTSVGSEDINDVWVSSTGNAYYAIDKGYTSTCTYTPGGGGGGSSCSTTTTSSGEDLDGISGSSKTDVLGVGKNGEVWSYDGTNWTAVTVSGNPGEDLKDVYAIDNNNSVAVGKKGTVLIESSGTWSTLTSPTSKELKGVWAYSTSEIYVFGKEGTIYSYDGSSWTNQSAGASTSNSDKFEDAWGNSTYVYGLTKDGDLFRYSRNASNWSKITTCAVGGNVEFKDLWGDGSGNIYLAGKDTNGVIYKYDGSTCSQVATASDDLKGIYGSSSTGEIYAVGKNGYIQYYNGSSWTESQQGSEDFNDVWVADDGTPYYSGDNGTLTTCSTPSTFDHIRITHDGTALTCEAESITFQACANSTCSSTYSGDVSVTLTPTGWTGGDTQTITGGSSTFTLSKTTAATYTLGVSTSSPSASNAVQCVNSGAGNSSCDITYYDTGFIYSVPDLTSCATSDNVTVSAVRLDNTSQACVPTFQNTTKTVNFWSGYTSPATGSDQVVLNNGSTNYTIATASPGTGVPLSFNGSGQATMTVTYDDAGQLSLNSSYSSGSLTMAGSDTFISVPAKLYVYDDDANADCASNDATCTAYTSAGSNFNLKVRAACADNSVTPNFILSNIAVTHSNTAPAIAQGTIGVTSFDMADADNGDHTISTQTVSEVGVFTFTATAPAYFGLTGPSGTSTYVGRFTPGQFCVSGNTLSNRTDSNTNAGCSDGFSYLDEDLSLAFTLTAQRNGASCGDGSSTQNYDGSFSKFANIFSADNTSSANETGVLNFGAIDNTTATTLNSRIDFNTASSSPNSGNFSSGTLSVTAKLDIDRAGSAPGYTAEAAMTDSRFGINPIDSDSVGVASTNLTIGSDNYYQLGSTSLYFGRLYADNAFGSELVPLPMWAKTQYCSAAISGVCNSWLDNSADTCSVFTVSAPTDTALGNSSAGDGQGYWNTGSDYSRTSGLLFSANAAGRTAGWQLYYTAGSTGGTYTIPFDSHPYLLSVDGAASFGLYRGDDRIIYWREVFN